LLLIYQIDKSRPEQPAVIDSFQFDISMKEPMSKRRTKRPPTQPKKKISETLIKFALPMLQLTGADAPQETIKEIFMIAVTIWNSVALEQLGKGSHFVEETRKQIRSGNMSSMSAVIDEMIERKRTQFATDLVMIGSHEVFFNSDGTEFTVRADARVPRNTIN
jgi:hypothetical protein